MKTAKSQYRQGWVKPSDPVYAAYYDEWGRLRGFIVFCVAILHAYWGFGGKFWADKAVPTTDDGAPLFVPSKIATFAVVGALLVLVWALLSEGAAARVISGVFALIFFARFVGEFNYVGMFKKHKSSEFARMDTLIYSPLCLFLSVCCALAILE